MPNPSNTDPSQNPDDLVPPADVQALFDEADDRGPYGAQLLLDRVQLVNVSTKEVVREVRWPQAGEFARRVLRNLGPHIPA